MIFANYPKMNTKDEALQKVKDNNKDEFNQLFDFSVKWLENRIRPFTIEDIKPDYEKVYGTPKQRNIYGALINALASTGKIREKGMITAKLPAAHGRKIGLWISTEYRLKQQTNAKAPYQNQISMLL